MRSAIRCAAARLRPSTIFSRAGAVEHGALARPDVRRQETWRSVVMPCNAIRHPLGILCGPDADAFPIATLNEKKHGAHPIVTQSDGGGAAPAVLTPFGVLHPKRRTTGQHEIHQKTALPVSRDSQPIAFQRQAITGNRPSLPRPRKIELVHNSDALFAPPNSATTNCSG